MARACLEPTKFYQLQFAQKCLKSAHAIKSTTRACDMTLSSAYTSASNLRSYLFFVYNSPFSLLFSGAHHSIFSEKYTETIGGHPYYF